MSFRPLHDRVLVRRVTADEKTAGGIIIPDTAKEKPQEGEVVSVGSGTLNDKGELRALDVKAGDRILFGKWSGTEVKLGGEELLIMKESDILGILDAPSVAKAACGACRRRPWRPGISPVRRGPPRWRSAGCVWSSIRAI